MCASKTYTGTARRMTENADMCKLLKKMSKLREKVSTLDWSNDAMFDQGTRHYPYLSANKVNRNVAPLFSEFGLEFIPVFSELTQRSSIGNMTQHWTVRMDAIIYDIDTGASITSTVYGEAADSGDKAVRKAQTSALKEFITKQYFTSGNMDDEETDDFVGRAYIPPKTDAEKKDAKNKIATQSAVSLGKTPEQTATPTTATPPAQATEVKPISPTQTKAIENILTMRKQYITEGTFTQEEFDKMKAESENVANFNDAKAFILKYKVM